MSTREHGLPRATESPVEDGRDPREEIDQRRVERTLASAGRIHRIWRVIRIAGWIAAIAMLGLGLVGVVAWIAQGIDG